MDGSSKLAGGIYKKALCFCAHIMVPVFILTAAYAEPSTHATMGEIYPDLASGILKSARLVTLEDNCVLTTEVLRIKKSSLEAVVNASKQELREQLRKTPCKNCSSTRRMPQVTEITNLRKKSS